MYTMQWSECNVMHWSEGIMWIRIGLNEDPDAAFLVNADRGSESRDATSKNC